ncbi:MAG: HlyD family efflux transporter periplasmic adaptor subunit [Deltaproteobacteria bacterium]|nr:HlyD family efflux transporter periplasmic adaptor subunit [Deltaproteobacteria bacterium]
MSTGIPAPHSRSPEYVSVRGRCRCKPSRIQGAIIPFGTVLSCLPLFFVLIITGCTKEHPVSFQGYVEGEYLRVSSPIAGQLVSLAVSRGMRVARGDPLFSLDRTYEAAALAAAQQGLLRAKNRLADLAKGLRPTELAAIKAKRAQAQAAYNLSRIEFERRKTLWRQNVIAREALDRTRTDMERKAAALAQLDAELQTARLGARVDEIKAARADVRAAREHVRQARWRLEEKSQTAPQAGLVFDTFYVTGEFVPAAHPVVSILPPGNIKIRFFVPEKVLGTLALGQKVSVRFDGAAKPYQAIISYISPRAEYTPPVIYSLETRSHLIFMIEARLAPKDAVALHPGQPVDVRPLRSDV